MSPQHLLVNLKVSSADSGLFGGNVHKKSFENERVQRLLPFSPAMTDLSDWSTNVRDNIRKELARRSKGQCKDHLFVLCPSRSCYSVAVDFVTFSPNIRTIRNHNKSLIRLSVWRLESPAHCLWRGLLL